MKNTSKLPGESLGSGKQGLYHTANQMSGNILYSDRSSLIFLILFISAGFLIFLNNRPLWAPDEIRVAGIGANMLAAKSWAVPLLNGLFCYQGDQVFPGWLP